MRVYREANLEKIKAQQREYKRAQYAANREAMRMRQRENRAWFKAHGICIRCGSELAMLNRTICAVCSSKRSEAMRKRKKDTKERNKAYRRNHFKSLRVRWREQGLCTICRGHRNDKRYLLCLECRLKRRKIYAAGRRKKGFVPRAAWASLGLCHFCGQPVDNAPESRVCAKHRVMIAKVRLHPNTIAAQKLRRERIKAREHRRFIAHLHSKGIAPTEQQLSGVPLPPRQERTGDEA